MQQNILVSGVSKGVGFEIAKLLLRSGSRVFGVCRSVSPELKVLADEYPSDLQIMQFDLADTQHLKQEIFSRYLSGIPIHGIVNNAAQAYDDLATNMNLDRLEQMFQVNVFAPMLLTKLAIRNMILHGISGSLIHISSISVHTGYKGLSMYASTKGALEAFSKNIAREWGSRGIRSNCIVAGFMETAMTRTLSTAQKERIFKRTALKKPTSKLAVAETVLFLLKNDSVTGQNIFVDSGTI